MNAGPPFSVEVALRHPAVAAVDPRWFEAVRGILADAGFVAGDVSLAVVDDREIHALNRRFLAHDEPTDVVSFVLESDGGRLEGEIVVSHDTACRVADEVGWSAADELLLYVIHGALHLAGYDDRSAADRQQMRAAETRHLARFGLAPPGN